MTQKFILKMGGLLLGLLFFQTAVGQVEFKKAFSSGERSVQIRMDNSEVIIEGYNGNELIIQTDERWEGPPERAKGLRALYNDAVDNTQMGLEVGEKDGSMYIKKAMSHAVSYSIKVPTQTALRIYETSWNSGGFRISNVEGEIEIETKNSDAVLKNVTGPVVANSTSGEITVIFSQLSQKAPSHISNVSGFVDITLPTNTKANLRLSSISGDVYTDMDIDFGEKKNLRRVGGQKISGQLNGGGVELALKSISDNVYLRKK